MALNLLKARGDSIERQRFTWRELAPPTISKLDCDAWTRVRIILMNGIESEALRFGHAAARLYGDLQQPLAVIRRIEQHQQTMVNWLLPAGPVAARDDDRLRAGGDRGHRRARARASPTRTWRRSTASGCSRTSTTCTGSRR